MAPGFHIVVYTSLHIEGTVKEVMKLAQEDLQELKETALADS